MFLDIAKYPCVCGGGGTKPPPTENHYSKFTLNIYKYLDHKLNNNLLFCFICSWGNLCPKQFLKSPEMQFSYVLSRSQMFCEIRRIFQNFQKLESRNLDHSWDYGEANKVLRVQNLKDIHSSLSGCGPDCIHWSETACVMSQFCVLLVGDVG